MPPTDPLPILTANAFAERAEASKHSHVDAPALADILRSRVQGEVRFDNSARALYATDGSSYRQVPIGVVLPRNNQDVIATMATCREYGAPVLSRGGGTSLA
jgi:FAD/FMN-containing dehydrogenase